MVLLANEKTVYHINMSIEVAANVLNNISFLLDTEAQPYLVAKSFFSTSWIIGIINGHGLNFCNTRNDPIIILGKIDIFIILVDLLTNGILNVLEI